MSSAEENTVPYESIAKYLSGEDSPRARTAVFEWINRDVNNEKILMEMDKIYSSSIINEMGALPALENLKERIKEL